MTKPYAVRLPAAEMFHPARAPLLSHLDIELTERCDNACVHCYISRPAADAEARAREMPAALVRTILEEAASLGCLGVRFTGGEPLLREDFEDLYVHARRLGLRVALFTNASLASPRIADLLARIPPLEPVEVSIYGMARASYEAVTGRRGSHERAAAGLRLLRERGVRVIAKMVALPLNAGEESRFEAWATGDLGMDRAPSFGVQLNLHGRRDAARNRGIRRQRLSADAALDVLARRPRDYVKGLKPFLISQPEGGGDALFSCGAGAGSCAVDAYGVIQPCLLLRHPETVAPYEGTGLRAALTGLFPEMRKRRAERSEYIERCGRCLLRGLCEQCPAQSWMEHGVLDAPVEPLCRAAHVQARAIGLLGFRERGWDVADGRARLESFSEERAADRLEARRRRRRGAAAARKTHKER
jgi:radical SAM protein with 4Fe4S-binding SPASM domain